MFYSFSGPLLIRLRIKKAKIKPQGAECKQAEKVVRDEHYRGCSRSTGVPSHERPVQPTDNILCMELKGDSLQSLEIDLHLRDRSGKKAVILLYSEFRARRLLLSRR